MAITYRELLEELKKLSEEHLDDNVTTYDMYDDEFYPVDGWGIQDEDDVLDEGHFYLTV